MACSCVRQTDLPHLSRLAADVLYDPSRPAAFYRHPNRDLDSYRSAAAEIHLPAERRAALIEALRVQNAPGASLERLAHPDAVAVVTGQQVGLFSGPAYTVYKALHAAKLAQWLTDNGLPAVPVFWLATEDHDFAEVNHVWAFNAAHQPARVEMAAKADSRPVGGVTLLAPPIDKLRAAMDGLPYCDEITDLVEQTYRPGVSMGEAFGALLRRILREYDILQVDPMLPAFRELAAPAMRQAVQRMPEISERVIARGRELSLAGYHAQVHVEKQTSFFFLLENGKRLVLRRDGAGYTQNGRRFSAGELVDRAASLSPNAILRPVVQDSMLPTVAYVGGGAEIAYLAQSEVIYAALLGRMPVAVPRCGFTILDGRSRRLMDRYGLSLPDFFEGEQHLRDLIAARLVPPALAGALQEARGAAKNALARLRDGVSELDPTLVRALERSGRKIEYQFEKIARKAGREAMARDARATRDAASLYGLVYPEKHLQERLYSILPFLAEHGLELIPLIYDAIQVDCPDHKVLTA